LLNTAPPRFVTVKLPCTFDPTAIVPNGMLKGETASCAGVNPIPVTLFVLFPPLLVNTTVLLNVPDTTGEKATATIPVAPGATLNGLPLVIENGPAVATAPVRVNCPPFITDMFCVALWPMIHEPKLRFVGLRTRIGGMFVA
jgi:hypothetical protein